MAGQPIHPLRIQPLQRTVPPPPPERSGSGEARGAVAIEASCLNRVEEARAIAPVAAAESSDRLELPVETPAKIPVKIPAKIPAAVPGLEFPAAPQPTDLRRSILKRRQLHAREVAPPDLNLLRQRQTAPRPPAPQSKAKPTQIKPTQAKPTQAQSPSERRPWGSQLLWKTGPFPLAWVLFVLGFSGVGVGAFVWLTALPPLPDCRQLNQLSTDAERLSCADQAARGGKEEDVRAALRLVQGWPADHPLRNQGQDLMKNWGKTLLLLARQKADGQDLVGAIALAQQIPSVTPDYKEAKEAIAAWTAIRDQGKKINASIQAALKIADWSEAQAKLLDLSKLDDNYSRQSVTQLRQQITVEQTAARQLAEIRNRVKAAPTQVDTLGQAIALAGDVPSSTYVFAKADKDIQRWSKTLLETMSRRLAKSDWVGANAVAQQLPLHRAYRPEDRDALWLSRAHIVATDQLPAHGLWSQLWTLWTTVPPVQDVQPTSPYAEEAKALLPRLTMQSQDLLQLQLAKTVAQVRLDPMLRWATQMVKAVTPDRPQRISAQTLLAGWRKDIELAEDYPLLIAARAIAQDGAKPKLQAAIGQARLVTPKRARRREAQTLIAQWTGQIQVIEDRPLIQQAKAIAAKGNLGEAIRVASQIRTGRALYPEAQTLVGDWITEIQIAEDQTVLDRAWDFASTGNLSAAIDAASRISPDRPLYSQAQGEITSWVREREAILQARRGEPSTPSDRPAAEPEPSPSGKGSVASPAPELPPSE